MNFNSYTIVPIFRCSVLLSVSQNVLMSRKARKEFGPFLLNCNPEALCSSEGNNFALFFNKDKLNHGIIAHEVFHLTHRIIDYVGGKFEMNNQEQHAYLCEWLTNWVYSQLTIHNFKI